MADTDWLALTLTYAAVPLAWLRGHPLVIVGLWGVLSALGTWLARSTRGAAERAELKRSLPVVFAFVVLLEGLGVDLPKVLAFIAWVVRRLLDKPAPPT